MRLIVGEKTRSSGIPGESSLKRPKRNPFNKRRSRRKKRRWLAAITWKNNTPVKKGRQDRYTKLKKGATGKTLKGGKR